MHLFEQRLQDVVHDLVKALNISPVTKEVAIAWKRLPIQTLRSY